MDNPVLENDNRDLIEMDRAHIWHHLSQHKKYESVDPTLMVEGKGMRVWDSNGKEYIDAVAGGVWTVNVGYGRESIADAVREQLAKMNFFSHAMGSEPGSRFAEKLLEKMPGMSRVYFSPSGSEANEKVYKMVRQISHAKHGGKKNKILYRARDYHGTTITALSSGGQDERGAQYGPMTPGFVEVPHCLAYRSEGGEKPDFGVRAAEAIEEVIKREGADTIGALVLEPITAGGGAIVPPEGYWDKVQEICRRYDILLHIDEVVCGFGRAGNWFAYQLYDVEPDFVTMAKGVASGYAAIACTVTHERVFQMFKDNPEDPLNYFRDISTFGGCTAGPAAALENMRIIEDEGLIENTAKVGDYLLKKLQQLQRNHEVVGDVRGCGLLAGIELVSNRETREPVEEARVQSVIAGCLRHGVIIGATNRSLAGLNNTLLLAPPLICSKKDVDAIVGTIDSSLHEEFT